MIKIALKHWIYDLCITQLFNGIAKNFIPPKPEEKWQMLITGYHYQWIKTPRKTYYDVYIMAITHTSVAISHKRGNTLRLPGMVKKEDILDFL